MTDQLALVQPEHCHEYDFQVALYITRLSIRNDVVLRKLTNMYAEELRALIGIRPLDEAITKHELVPLLKFRLGEFVLQSKSNKTVLQRNIRLLSQLLNIEPLEQQIAEFCALAQHHHLLNEIIEGHGVASLDAFTRLLTIAIDANPVDVKKALAPMGNLLRQRVLYLNNGFMGTSTQPSIMADLYSIIFTHHASIKSLMSSFIEHSPKPLLHADDFEHLHESTQLLVAYLTEASLSKMRGVNILIYGTPGTGKTEYIRWLAKHLNKKLYAVKSSNKEGKSISGIGRLAFFQFCQQFLSQTNALVLFDEVEDVFIGSDDDVLERLLNKGENGASKAWFNHLLETNPVPAIWISNAVSHIDEAYLRRFDLSFEMGVPPASIRQRILHKYLKRFPISPQTLKQLAQYEHLSPAQIEKAAKVLKTSSTSPQTPENTLKQVIHHSMRLLGQPLRPALTQGMDAWYSLQYLNADCDLPTLVAQLQAKPKIKAALCFYGVSGSGKSAFAQHIAHAMDKPLVVRRASDILSQYVGGAERNIAAMFQLAYMEDAVLLLDEADSFLMERQGAQHSWQVTQVNEMLTQMETFQGLFICSTNLMAQLDQASLRRFAFKIKFDYISLEQRWLLFLQHVTVSANERDRYKQALAQLNTITPGDFATVRRQVQLLDEALTAELLLHKLQLESHMKPVMHSKAIGFIHASTALP